jgi:phosphate transport system ATP-binding protein
MLTDKIASSGERPQQIPAPGAAVGGERLKGSVMEPPDRLDGETGGQAHPPGVQASIRVPAQAFSVGGPEEGSGRVDEASSFRPSLIARDFTLYYGQRKTLKEISLEIPEHAVTAIIGPSGCGKSTLLRSFNRMNDLIPGVRTEGSLYFGELDIRASSTDVVALRRRIGMVFQRPNPFPKSIFDNVVFGLRMLGLSDRSELEARAEQSLRRAALWEEVKDSLRRSALQLSGGQQQRLCIARCLAVEPEVILMDEPASALDPAATSRIEELIMLLKSQYTIVIVTHNMQQAARVSDRTAFLLNGDLIEYDVTRRLFTNPRVKATEDYITGRFG